MKYRPFSSSLEFSNKIIASKIRVPSAEFSKSLEELPFSNSIFQKAIEREKESISSSVWI